MSNDKNYNCDARLQCVKPNLAQQKENPNWKPAKTTQVRGACGLLHSVVQVGYKTFLHVELIICTLN